MFSRLKSIALYNEMYKSISYQKTAVGFLLLFVIYFGVNLSFQFTDKLEEMFLKAILFGVLVPIIYNPVYGVYMIIIEELILVPFTIYGQSIGLIIVLLTLASTALKFKSFDLRLDQRLLRLFKYILIYSALILGTIIFSILLPGSLKIYGIGFDIHSLILGMLMIILGSQVITLGLFAKIFSYTEKFASQNTFLVRLGRALRLETTLIIGLIIVIAGFSGYVLAFLDWAESGYGPLKKIRLSLLSSTQIIFDFQIIFSGIYLNILGIRQNTYIGD